MTTVLRSASALALAAAALSASAAPTISLLTPNAVVARPASGSVTYQFVGNLVADAGTTFDSLATVGDIFVSGDPTGLDTNASGGLFGKSTYTGTLVSYTISATTALGTYDSASPTSTAAPYVSVFDSGGGGASATYSLTVVNPTPEPSALAALGLGAIGVLRRRRKA